MAGHMSAPVGLMDSLVLDIIDLTTDEIASNTKCFHAKLSVKLAFVTYPWASSFNAGQPLPSDFQTHLLIAIGNCHRAAKSELQRRQEYSSCFGDLLPEGVLTYFGCGRNTTSVHYDAHETPSQNSPTEKCGLYHICSTCIHETYGGRTLHAVSSHLDIGGFRSAWIRGSA